VANLEFEEGNGQGTSLRTIHKFWCFEKQKCANFQRQGGSRQVSFSPSVRHCFCESMERLI